MGKIKEVFDLEKQFAFYGAYHSNQTNVLIHMLFVWPILFTFILILYFTPSLFGIPRIQISIFETHLFLVINFGFIVSLVYSVIYVIMDPKAGSFAALLCMLCWVSSTFLAQFLGFSLAWKVVLVAQLVCWTGQFIGHGVFEKRAPALLDNLLQAFLMAPFFVILEGLQSLFHYEPYPGFHARVESRIASEISEWQEKKEKLVS